MAKTPTRRLKVFAAQFGFYESVIAAPSQAAALRAWETRQNLFADGQARVETDPAAVAAAMAHPQTPLLRAVGSNDAFNLKTTSLPKLPTSAPLPLAKPGANAKPPPPPSAADRSALDAAESSLRALEDGRKREETDFRRRQDELDAQATAAHASYVETRKAATAAVARARKIYRAAGGES